MSSFKWIIDSEEYLSNNDKYADKMKSKDFIAYIIKNLNDYQNKTWNEIQKKRHCHSCPDLFKKSDKAKRLVKHLEKINEKLGNKQCRAIEASDIYQLEIKGVPNKSEYRCFGYVLEDVFHLIYLDPNHEIYKE